MPRLTRVQPATRDLGWIDIVVPALLEAIGGSRFRRQVDDRGGRWVDYLVWSLWAERRRKRREFWQLRGY